VGLGLALGAGILGYKIFKSRAAGRVGIPLTPEEQAYFQSKIHLGSELMRRGFSPPPQEMTEANADDFAVWIYLISRETPGGLGNDPMGSQILNKLLGNYPEFPARPAMEALRAFKKDQAIEPEELDPAWVMFTTDILSVPPEKRGNPSFHPNGQLSLVTLAAAHKLGKILFPRGSSLRFDESGKLQWAVLGGSCLIEGVRYPRDSYLQFKDGKLVFN